MNASMIKSAIEKNRAQKNELHVSPIAVLILSLFIIIAVLGAIVGSDRYADWLVGLWVLGFTLVGMYFLFALKVASQWEKVVVLRLGKFIGLKGPGVFWVVPILDQAVLWVDHRVMVTSFS